MKRAAVPAGIILEGDCLDLLPGLVGARAKHFDLCYVDPPFNTGVHRAARGERGERARGQRVYQDHWPSVDAFVEWLALRIAAVREVLSERGSLWLHLDHRAVHEVKCAADHVFGRKRFCGEVIWVPGNGGRRRNGPALTHQTILVYRKGPKMIWNAAEPALREPYAGTSLRMHFNKTDGTGRRYREREIGGRKYRYYADVGRQLGSVWNDCPAMRANTPLIDETTGYPTQKPETLLKRIVLGASVAGSRVLDPMCGSGTTLAAAASLGRSWAGIDRSPAACDISRRRLARCAERYDMHAPTRTHTHAGTHGAHGSAVRRDQK